MSAQDGRTALRAPQVPGTAAFAKFLSVLQMIADEPGCYNVARLHRETGMPRGTLHRIVSALLCEGLAVEDPNGMLDLGPRLINLASRAWDRLDLRALARDEIMRLRDATGETVHLAVQSGREMVYIDKLESLRAVRMTSRIGARIPLHSTSVGKAYLAAVDAATRTSLLNGLPLPARTAHTVRTRKALETEIAATIRRGYSIDQEETELDIICYGCAIRGGDGRPVGAVSITIPKYRLNAAASRACRDGVVACATRISERILAMRGAHAD